MSILIVLVSIWSLLMLRSGVIEYKYYQSIKTLEPDIWRQLGSPKFIKIPFVFVSPKKSTLLQQISNKTVCDLAIKNEKLEFNFWYMLWWCLWSALYISKRIKLIR